MCLRKLQRCKFMSFKHCEQFLYVIEDTNTILTEYVQYCKKKVLRAKDAQLLASFKASSVPYDEETVPTWLASPWSHYSTDSSNED